jgi:hypothetical protein
LVVLILHLRLSLRDETVDIENNGPRALVRRRGEQSLRSVDGASAILTMFGAASTRIPAAAIALPS